MKTILGSLKSNWKLILIGIGGLIAIIELFRFWIWISYLTPSPDNAAYFNNVATPVVSLIGAIGVLITLIYLRFQNRLIKSQSHLPYYERKFSRVYEKVAEYTNIPEFPLPNGQIHFMDRIDSILLHLSVSQDYLQLISNHNSGQQVSIDSINNAPYYKMVAFLNIYFIYDHFSPLDTVELLIKELNSSELTDEDIILKKNEVKDVLVGRYMAFIEADNSMPVPKVFLVQNPDNVEFVRLEHTGFGKYYAFLKQELG